MVLFERLPVDVAGDLGIGLCLAIWASGILLIAPWLLGIRGRRGGQLPPPPPLKARMGACFVAMLATVAGIVTAIMGLELVETLGGTGLLTGNTRGFAIAFSITLFSCGTLGGILVLRAILRPHVKLARVVISSVVMTTFLYLGWMCFRSGGERAMFFAIAKPSDRKNLQMIQEAVSRYRTAHGQFPSHLQELSTKEFLDGQMLQDIDCSGVLGPCDPNKAMLRYDYLPLPKDAPENLVWVWHSPRLLYNEGSYILRKSGSVEWVRTQDMLETIIPTYRWLMEHPSCPSSHPAQ